MGRVRQSRKRTRGRRIAERHGHLLWRILRQYAAVTEPVQIGPVALEFTRIAEPNRVLDEVALEEDRREKATGRRKREDELHLPYWAELWSSSLGLATYLVEQWVHCGGGTSAVARLAREAMRNGRVVHAMDLGCGMGLVGAVGARLGMHMLFADLETPALLFARLNGLADAARCRVRKVNWQTDRLSEQFDLILGADIVYDRGQWQFIDPFLRAHLADGGTVLLGEPGRSSGEEFEPWIRGRGWQVERHEQVLPGRGSAIQLIELRLSDGHERRGL
jgi:predicted nicotinamide N-methyase